MERDLWPVKVKVSAQVPEEEMKQVNTTIKLEVSWAAVASQVLDNAKSLQQAIGTLACFMLAAIRGRKAILIEPAPSVRSKAWKLLLWASQVQVREEFEKNQFLPLGATLVDGIIVCRGRFSEDRLMEMLGVPNLPILHSSSKLARLIMAHAHEIDHRRGATAILAASRRWV